MVGLDWLDLDFFFHHFFQGSVPKFEFRRPRMRMGPGPGPGPGPMGPHGALWGPMGPPMGPQCRCGNAEGSLRLSFSKSAVSTST